MRPYNAEAGAYGQAAGRDPNAILNECKELDRGIDSIGHNLERLRALQRQSLEDTDASPKSQINREIDSLNSSTMTMYRSFGQRIKAIKQQPESGDPRNAPQVGRVDRKLKTAINEYQQVERDFRLKLQAQMERQYRIVRPDATDAEVREACEDATSQQVFSQAVSNCSPLREMILSSAIASSVGSSWTSSNGLARRREQTSSDSKDREANDRTCRALPRCRCRGYTARTCCDSNRAERRRSNAKHSKSQY